MPSNALQATITAALAPSVAAIYLLVHVPESAANQSIIVAGASALVAVIFGIYAAFAHHGANQVKVAKALHAVTFTQTSTSGGSSTIPTITLQATSTRKRPSRAKPKTPPAA